MRVFTEYSMFLLPICLLVGVAIAFFLYHNDGKLKEAPLWVRRLLFVLRTFVVAVLLFLLLGPFIEIRKQQIEKPVVVVLHDNSASLVLQKDSIFYKTTYLNEVQSFIEKLKETHSVEQYSFAEEVSFDSSLTFQGKETNISNALQDVSTRYFHQNIGAVVLASDGIYNAGENPKYSIQNFPATMPIYTLALGDTVQECDNVISEVLHNQIAFRDNPFVVKVAVESHSLKGKNSKVVVLENDNIVFETSFQSNDAHVYKTIDCKLKSNEIGKKIYTVQIEHHNGEISEVNNTYTFAVDVLESRQKILILYDAVHPDVAAIRRAIESNKNYECEVACVSEGNMPKIQDCNCVVLVGLPNSYGKGKTIANEVVNAGVPFLIVYNSNVALETINSLNLGVSVSNFRRSYDEAKPILSSDFSLFSLDESSQQLLNRVPPLVSPYGSYQTGAQSKMFLSQRIGNIDVDRPLAVFSEVRNVKIGMILGEGLWRWRLYDYKESGSFASFDALINKMIAYLALAEKRELFVVNGEQIVADNKNVKFTAELYDKSFEPLPNQEISMVITNSEGTEYPFSFTSTDNFYTLNAGKFPAGEYFYKSMVTVDGMVLKKTGSFVVLPLQSEYKQTRANHAVLRDLSEQTQGKLFYPNEFDDLLQEIQSNKNIVSVAHTTKNRNLAVDLPLILIIIVLSASVEWFLRKYYATY